MLRVVEEGRHAHARRIRVALAPVSCGARRGRSFGAKATPERRTRSDFGVGADEPLLLSADSKCCLFPLLLAIQAISETFLVFSFLQVQIYEATYHISKN